MNRKAAIELMKTWPLANLIDLHNEISIIIRNKIKAGGPDIPPQLTEILKKSSNIQGEIEVKEEDIPPHLVNAMKTQALGKECIRCSEKSNGGLVEPSTGKVYPMCMSCLDLPDTLEFLIKRVAGKEST